MLDGVSGREDFRFCPQTHAIRVRGVCELAGERSGSIHLPRATQQECGGKGVTETTNKRTNMTDSGDDSDSKESNGLGQHTTSE